MSDLGNRYAIAAVITAKGYGEGARAGLMHRVRANLAYLWRRGMVTKTGVRAGAALRAEAEVAASAVYRAA